MATIAKIGSRRNASCSPHSADRRADLLGQARQLWRIVGEIIEGFVAAERQP
jgi:hypothetical protein